MAIMLERHMKSPFRSASDLCVRSIGRQSKIGAFVVDYSMSGRFLGVSMGT